MLKKTLKVIGLSLGFLLLIFIIANAKDDVLRPEVKEALNWQVPADAFDKENGYVLLHGMYAPIGQDPYLAGKAILEAEIARYQEFQKTHIEPTIIEREGNNPFPKWSDKQCKFTETQNCVDFYLTQSATNVESIFETAKAQAERFNALKTSKKFVEVNSPIITSLLPSYEAITQLTETERVLALQEISSGKLDVGLNRLAENNRFSRRLLSNSGTLVTHMIAVGTIQKDTRMMSEILVKYPEIAKYNDQIQSIARPISSSEYSLTKAFKSERLMQVSIVDTISNAYELEKFSIATIFSRSIMSAQWLPNSTKNLFYDWGNGRIELAETDAHKLNQKTEEITRKQTELLGVGYDFLYLRNPIGKILVSVADPSYINYIERHHDLDGYLTLVRMQHKLIADKLSKDQVVQILPKYPNPYTLEPMRLDTQNGFIIFEGRQPSNSNFKKSSSYQIALPK